MLSPADLVTIPFDDWMNSFVRGWLVPNFRPFFRAAQVPISSVLNTLNAFMLWVPMLVTTLAFALAAWRWAGKGTAIFTLVGFAFMTLRQVQLTLRRLAGRHEPMMSLPQPGEQGA